MKYVFGYTPRLCATTSAITNGCSYASTGDTRKEVCAGYAQRDMCWYASKRPFLRTTDMRWLCAGYKKSWCAILATGEQEHQKSIFSVPRPLKINTFCPQSLTNNQTPSAVAGTQLCCALDNVTHID